MSVKSFFGVNCKERRRFFSLSIVFALLLLLLFISSACSTPGGRSVGVVYDDALISSKVKTRLTEMLGGLVVGIDVDVYQGEVTLQGRVRSPNMESRVIAVAAQVQGVKKVINLLKIIP
jgi:hyperosmotically inducible protein